MNLFQKFSLLIQAFKDKLVFKKLEQKSIRLKKSLRTSHTDSSSKTIITSSITASFTSETEKQIEIVKNNAAKIVKSCGKNPYELLEYVKSQGTPVHKIDNADVLLSAIDEDEGFITELRGIKALYLNMITKTGISFKTEPMFVMREGKMDFYVMVLHFYKWYSQKSKLPGFEYKTRQNFKKYIRLKNPDAEIKTLKPEEILALKDAIARDREANDFVLNLANSKEGAKNALDKMTSGGANV